MAPKKDDLGVEYDEEVEAIINEPKSAVLLKFMDYRDKRKEAERLKAEQEKPKPEKEKFLGLF